MLPMWGGEHTIQHGTSDRGVMEPKGVDNSKELLATWIALQTFANTLRGAHVHIKIDNTSAIAYINRMGGVITLSRAAPDSYKYVELVLGSRSDNLGRTSTRNPECHSQLRVQEQEGHV